MFFFVLLRKADEMGVNFWLRLIAVGLCISLVLLASYYFLIVNQQVSAPPVATENPSLEKLQNDAALSTRIRSVITRTKRLYNLSIGIENSNGVITLTGDVPSEIDKDLAGTLARETPGVREVRNQLQVVLSSQQSADPVQQITPRVSVEDLELEANLREIIQNAGALNAQTIAVKVNKRAVTLSGRVANESQRQRAEQLMRENPKVDRVMNELRVGN